MSEVSFFIGEGALDRRRDLYREIAERRKDGVKLRGLWKLLCDDTGRHWGGVPDISAAIFPG